MSAINTASGTERGTDAQPRGQRVPDPQRPGHADGRPAAPLLDAGVAQRGTARARRAAQEDQDPGRGPAGLPRTDGRVGIVEPHCPHRGANLYFGRNEECGLRCAFHGWKFDVDGNCVDLPTSPPESAYKDTIKLLAYPTREWGDMIWVYMGPREKMPELPQLEMGLVPASQRYVSKKWQDCNWVQSLEGGIDTAHFSFLHAVLTKDEKEALAIYSRSAALGDQSKPDDRVRWIRNDPRPKFSILGHDAGLVIGGARKTDGPRALLAHRPVPDAQPCLRAGGDAGRGLLRPGLGAGERHQLLDLYLQLAARPRLHQLRARAVRRRLRRARPVDDDYMPLRNLRERVPDRPRGAEAPRASPASPASASRTPAIQDSQGPIQDRTKEHLGPTDLGIVEFRKLVMGAARALQPRQRAEIDTGCEEICRALRRLGRRSEQGSRRSHDRAFRTSARLCRKRVRTGRIVRPAATLCSIVPGESSRPRETSQ